LNITEALKVFRLQEMPDYTGLKTQYRLRSFETHPDTGGTDEKFQELSRAMFCLEQFVLPDRKWSREQADKLPEWEKEFQSRWKQAFNNSLRQKADDGLHFQTTIKNFSSGHIYPLEQWFTNVLFGVKSNILSNSSIIQKQLKDKETAQEFYRRHLLRIAPNPRMAETYAKRYWELEFKEKWIFYLPAARGLICA
jgi:hypothetical protein